MERVPDTSAPAPGPDNAPIEADTAPWVGYSAQMSSRYVTAVVAALTTIVLTSVALLLPVPYATMEPGPVFNTLGEFNGEPMLESPHLGKAAARSLDAARSRGRRVLLLTTTERGLDVLPIELRSASLLARGSVVLKEQIHHPMNRSYALREHPVAWSLWLWSPSP